MDLRTNMPQNGKRVTPSPHLRTSFLVEFSVHILVNENAVLLWACKRVLATGRGKARKWGV